MDNVKDDRYYLRKIIDHIDFVLQNTKGLNLEQIENNEMLIDSVMFRFIQIA